MYRVMIMSRHVLPFLLPVLVGPAGSRSPTVSGRT
jgi:hypothetical protein